MSTITIPCVLEATLLQLFEKNRLCSWNVHGGLKTTTVTIRFENEEESHVESHTAFRRKSPSEIKRDQHRAFSNRQKKEEHRESQDQDSTQSDKEENRPTLQQALLTDSNSLQYTGDQFKPSDCSMVQLQIESDITETQEVEILPEFDS